MIKKIVYGLIVITIVFIVVWFLTNPLTRSEKTILNNIMRSIPIGTKMEDVIHYIENNTEWEITGISYKTGFYFSANVNKAAYFKDSSIPLNKDRSVGEKAIRVYMGGYRIFFTADVTAYFGFDENSELIGIWVVKHFDAL